MGRRIRTLLRTWERKGSRPKSGKGEEREAIARLALIEELKAIAREAKNAEDAIYNVLERFGFPMTFSDIKYVMPEDDKHGQTITNALKRLLREKRIKRIWILTPDEATPLYATEKGYQNFENLLEDVRRRIRSALQGCQIDRIGDQSSEGPSRKGAQRTKKRPPKGVSTSKLTGASVTGNRSEASSTC
jgi:hypothetical protein